MRIVAQPPVVPVLRFLHWAWSVPTHTLAAGTLPPQPARDKDRGGKREAEHSAHSVDEENAHKLHPILLSAYPQLRHLCRRELDLLLRVKRVKEPDEIGRLLDLSQATDI